ncbi:hypothetical protein TIN2_50 [Tsukamurella phage TIN2]|uniref:Uncharacterized protein n=1 Tax=Tsukamurella phage TIN2 TaxID=1636545 RepID=A0A0K0N4Y7_9CAUD|nr:hypothetical protein AVT55_gp073 [Tsukamurella phage TIN2]AKJ71740.1 hypothetical protein TIN2_50 [Tsukamurella phage TIN2]
MNTRKRCEFPNDKHANLIPVSLEDATFRYQIEWDSQYKNAPLELRSRHICEGCQNRVYWTLMDLMLESMRIDKYYGKESHRERCT